MERVQESIQNTVLTTLPPTGSKMTKTAPATKSVYKCEWRDVVALNFEVDPRVLQPRLPEGTRIERYNDHTLVTLMAKNIREFRPWGRSLTLFRSLDEIDLRAYINYESGGELHRGHFKLRNFVAGKMGCRVLKFLTGQKQEFVSSTRSTSGFEEARRDALPSADYRWNHGDSKNHFRVKARKQAQKSQEGSKEQFVLEQLNRFVKTSRGTLQYPIRQAPWLVWNASSGSFDCDTANLLGAEFRKYLNRPSFVLLSRGGEVTVYKGKKIG